MNNKGKQWRFWVLLGVLTLSGAFVNTWERRGEAHAPRRVLKELPAEIGTWRQTGADERFDAETEKVLRADDYLSRSYVLPNNHVVSLYVGYYATQRNGATYHSPLNCLPGSGWNMTAAETVKVNPVDGAPTFEANRYIIQKGDYRQLLVYWYQGRGRSVASEYWGKVYTVVDSARRRRSDGAMVRVMTPITSSDRAALDTALDLAAQVAPLLPEYVPN